MFCLNCASDCFFAYIKQTAQAYASVAPKAGVIAGNPCSSLVITVTFLCFPTPGQITCSQG
jgi:hypothetical protein